MNKLIDILVEMCDPLDYITVKCIMANVSDLYLCCSNCVNLNSKYTTDLNQAQHDSE